MTKTRKENEQVRKALLDAAVEAYTGDGEFSVRKIATRAGVNHGQIHHQFGGKEGLKQSMLDYLAAEQSRHLQEALKDQSDSPIGAAFQAVTKDRRFIRALARQLLEAPDDTPPQQHFPVVERLRTFLQSQGIEDPTPILAAGLAAGMGWVMFGPWIQQAAGMDEQDIMALEQLMLTFAAE